jgi:hypothetical protein
VAPCRPPPHPKQNPLCPVPVEARRAWAMCLLALVHWTPVLPAGWPFPPVLLLLYFSCHFTCPFKGTIFCFLPWKN